MIRTIENYKPGGKATFATYIITIAKNTFIDYIRRNKIIFSELAEDTGQNSESMENKIFSDMQYEKIVEYIDSLPPNQATVIRLKYIDEYTLKEIESITGVPVKTVKSRIHEETKKLLKFLKFGKKE